MPFALKNAKVTYQQAMTVIFRNQLQKIMDCYVNDITVKNRDKEIYVKNLRTIFDLMKAHQLKINPTKSFLWVSSRKFIGFIVMSKGIHLDHDKVKAIQ